MPLPLIATLAALLYLVATGMQLVALAQRGTNASRLPVSIAVLAMACHALVAWDSISTEDGVHLGFYKVAALVFLAVNIACVVAIALKRPLHNLLLVLFPLSAVAVMVSSLGPQTEHASHLGHGLLIHVASSIIAYAVLTLAAVQAGVLAVQDRQLHERHPGGIVKWLPPLQRMEAMLFELLWVGVILLTVAIVTGFIFVEDLFAQHLVHKTVLTIVAWMTFSSLLWGHYQLGWRSQTAVRLTLAGFLALMLAFFGSKLVLELILQR
ncbi:cytochrome C biogenesis protein [Parahaliea maris]|uniref:Cytochrome C biogenesis protein n=1 Tax=Parahaliea maris TaxID=2716870 RepID=A0A5C9A5P8_9GAMM|nr:cytochrome c biogenesis protein CcsA [Parahaliea maris]TXS96016.1 cytochrome C biogenesis protein [Parahaliea maris]